jgi:hypothetical protein
MPFPSLDLDLQAYRKSKGEGSGIGQDRELYFVTPFCKRRSIRFNSREWLSKA